MVMMVMMAMMAMMLKLMVVMMTMIMMMERGGAACSIGCLWMSRLICCEDGDDSGCRKEDLHWDGYFYS